MSDPAERSLRETTARIIFGTGTTAGRNFDIALLIAIVTSVTVVMIDSVAEYHTRYGVTLFQIELVFTALFTAEYLIRIWAAPARLSYVSSYWGIIDLLSILPTYVALLVPEAEPLMVVRLLRVLRVFRVLRMFELFHEFMEILKVLRSTAHSILVFATLVTVLMIIFGSLMYVAEGPEPPFSSIPISIYWAIVTITTVGYGDVIPQTPLGRVIASAGMLIGYSIIAVPTAIITAKLWERLNDRSRREFLSWNCPVCAGTGHAMDAEFCKHCGAALDCPEELRHPPDDNGKNSL